MSFEKMLNSKAQYRSYVGDGAGLGYTAEYEAFELESVMVRLAEGADSGKSYVKEAVLYFFPALSKCFDKNGVEVTLPTYKVGDTCVIMARGGTERVLRVVEAGYFDDVDSGLSHIRLKLA